MQLVAPAPDQQFLPFHVPPEAAPLPAKRHHQEQCLTCLRWFHRDGIKRHRNFCEASGGVHTPRPAQGHTLCECGRFFKRSGARCCFRCEARDEIEFAVLDRAIAAEVVTPRAHWTREIQAKVAAGGQK